MTNFILKPMLQNMQLVLFYPNNKKTNGNQLHISQNHSPSLNKIMKFTIKNYLQSCQHYNTFDIILWVQNKSLKFGWIMLISNISKNLRSSIINKLVD